MNTSTSPRVQFLNYDTAGTAGVYTNGLRRLNVYYPVASGARLAMYYGTNDSLTDRLHRTHYEKLWGGTALNGNQANTSYCSYNGLERVVRVWNDNVFGTDAERKMYSSAGIYDSFDRYGRPVKFAWKKQASGTLLDQVDYTYDYAGNRLARDIPATLYATNNRDQVYDYDGLQRLTTFDEGTLSGATISGTPGKEEDYTLDQLGNWPGYVQKAAGSTTLNQQRYHNAVNEIDGNGGNSITSTGGETKGDILLFLH